MGMEKGDQFLSCSLFSGIIRQSAGPPIFHVVYFASGSFHNTVPILASDSSDFHCCILNKPPLTFKTKRPFLQLDEEMAAVSNAGLMGVSRL